MEPVVTKHISTRADVCGGKPCISDTRIRVWDIHVWHDLRGQSPEEIVATFPQISVADVHACIAYYIDNREVIELQMQQARDDVARMETEQGPTKFSKLSDELLIGEDAGDDPLPSG